MVNIEGFVNARGAILTQAPKTPIYDRIGSGYDVTRQADPYIAERLAHHLLLQDIGIYLDVACGTGNYPCALADRGRNWVGIDISSRMIGLARAKTSAVQWTIAKAENLPFVNQTFSGAICVLALHHLADLRSVFSEIYRVLDRGRLVIFTADPDQMRSYWLNEYFPDAMLRSIEQMPGLEQISENLINAGFSEIQTDTYEITPDLEDLFLYSGKHRPQLYLDEGFRRNISTFSNLASLAEVREGSVRLAQDIESGRISEVISRYGNRSGDYRFVIGFKGV